MQINRQFKIKSREVFDPTRIRDLAELVRFERVKANQEQIQRLVDAVIAVDNVEGVDFNLKDSGTIAVAGLEIPGRDEQSRNIVSGVVKQTDGLLESADLNFQTVWSTKGGKEFRVEEKLRATRQEEGVLYRRPMDMVGRGLEIRTTQTHEGYLIHETGVWETPKRAKSTELSQKNKDFLARLKGD